MANWKKISLAAVIVLGVGIGGAVYLRPRAALVPQPAPAPTTSADQDLVLQGRAYCALTDAIVCPMQGKVAQVLVTVGQAVKKDDPLIRLDLLPQDAAAMMQRANKGSVIHSQELLIKEYQFKLSQLERSIQETQKLEAAGLAPRNALPELQEQKTLVLKQIDVAQQNLSDGRRTANEDLKVLSDLLGYKVAPGSQPTQLIVRAPQDGHIIGIEPSVTPGATVGGKVMTLGVMDRMVIRGQVHESEIGRLKAGENATITLDSSQAKPMAATLTSVSWAAQDSSLAAPSYYLFELTVANPELIIRDGNKVQVTFKAHAANGAPEVQQPPAVPDGAPGPASPEAKPNNGDKPAEFKQYVKPAQAAPARQ
ncbi:MAG: HlyD family efflux transporter periplasmic adaptor subunit [Humidesulfovibrio sp.]|nr:HlyD family efflux transporter periplasmic adaptor subunit [Humidesulfovibrio sp.]